VYLTIADKSYPRKLAFLYLDELAREFWNSYGAKVETARKPYAFVGFGTFKYSPFGVVEDEMY
jgi:vesicle transport protein SEC22